MIFKPKYNPKTNRAGSVTQAKNVNEPRKTMEISLAKPRDIKKILAIAPKPREIALKIKTSRFSLRVNPLL